MTKNKSFFQKLSDSLTSLFPFNSAAKDVPNISQASFDANTLPVRFPSNRRNASNVFDKEDDQIKIKRAKLHHDPMELPTSRIMKPPLAQLSSKVINHNNFNDAASDFSDISNVSVSTSGVSSLHPRSNKRINLTHSEDASMQQTRKYPRNLNLSNKETSPVHNKTLKLKNDFISSPARKILEKLDRLTTPVTAGNKLTSVVQRNNYLNQGRPSPYSRPKLPICGKSPAPMKAITVSASSNEFVGCDGPIRGKKSYQLKKFGYSDAIDLDSNSFDSNYLNESNHISFSNTPILKKTQATNTDDIYLGRSSPALEFTFRAPKSFNDIDNEEYSKEQSIEYKLKSYITQDELEKVEHRSSVSKVSTDWKLWKCITCLMENKNDQRECQGCGSLASQNNHHITVSHKMSPVSVDKSAIVKQLLENEKMSDIKDAKISEESKQENGSISTSKNQLFSNATLTASSSILFGNVTVTKATDSRLSLFPGSTATTTTSSEPKISLFPDSKTASTSIASLGKIPLKSTVSSEESIIPSSVINTTVTTTSTESKPLSTTFNFNTGSENLASLSANSSAEPQLFSFGKPSASTASSSHQSIVSSKPFSGTTVPVSSVASSSFSFMPTATVSTAISSVSAPVLFGASKPFCFDQQAVSSAASSTNSEVKVTTLWSTSTTLPKTDLFGAGATTVSSAGAASSASESKPMPLFGQVAPANTDSKPFVFKQTVTATSATGAPTDAVTSKPVALFGAFAFPSSGALSTGPASPAPVSTLFTSSAKSVFSEQPSLATVSSTSSVTTSGLFQFGATAPSAPIRSESASFAGTSLPLFGASVTQATVSNPFGASSNPPVAEQQQPVFKASTPGFAFSTSTPAVSMAIPQFSTFNPSFSAAPSSAVAPKTGTFLFTPQAPAAVSQAVVAAPAPATGITGLFGAPASQPVSNAFSQNVASQQPFQFGAPSAPVTTSNAGNNANTQAAVPMGSFDFKSSGAPVFQFGGASQAANCNDFQFNAGAAGGGGQTNGNVFSFGGGSVGTGNTDASGQVMQRRTLKVRRKR